MTVYRIRHAGPRDLDACLELRVRAEERLAASGIDQWHDRAHGRRVITEWISQGAMHVVTTQAGDIVACFALAAADPAFWRPEEAAQPALYLYKFIIAGSHRGAGLGARLLDWCAARAAAAGARWLRLDCWRTNTGLHRYWLKQGFRLIDIREHPVRNSGALFERPLDAGKTLTGIDKINIVDETSPALTAAAPMRTPKDRYDPTGEATVWAEAAAIVAGMTRTGDVGWNAALDQAARALEMRACQARQEAGMFYRVIS